MLTSKSMKQRAAFCVAIVLAAGILRAIIWTRSDITYHGILSMMYLAVYFQWLFSIQRRFIQKDMRRILMTAAWLMIFWNVLRFVKYEFTEQNSFMNRQLWYWYYVPMTLLPLLMFLATLYIGKTDQSRISKYWKLLYIPAGIIIIGILTNDLHQRAFSFPTGLKNWEGKYRYELLYFAVAVLMILSLIGIVIVVFRTCAKRHFVKHLWLAGVVVIAFIVYTYLHTSDSTEKMWFQLMFEIPEFFCLALIAFWESLVFTRLIPSNTNHEVFFEKSSIHAGLTDDAYHVKLKSTEGSIYPEKQLKKAEKAPIFVENGDTLLKNAPVQGGHFYWTEDVRELNRLNQELEEAGNYLEEENIVLEAANVLEETRKKTREQNRLYDEISDKIRPQLTKVSLLLRELPEEEDEFRQVMKQAGILGAYVKRCSNLLLLAGSGEKIYSEELGISIAESLEYVRLLEIPCHAEIEKGYGLDTKMALLIYELFEAVLEKSLPTCNAVLVALNRAQEEVNFYMEIGLPQAILEKDWKKEEISRLGGKLEIEVSEETEFVTFTAKVPLEGAPIMENAKNLKNAGGGGMV